MAAAIAARRWHSEQSFDTQPAKQPMIAFPQGGVAAHAGSRDQQIQGGTSRGARPFRNPGQITACRRAPR
ncbi:MAG TPA: hypothetical protein VIC03_04540 [Gemmatimonadaceae bacterium]|jgi:hypothetical protein